MATRKEAFSFLASNQTAIQAIVDKGKAVYPFVAKFLNHCQLPETFIRDTIGDRLREFEQNLLERSTLTANSTIPKITHKIWLTSAAEPSLPPIEQLEIVAKFMSNFPPNWIHIFWTNSPAVAEFVEDFLNKRGLSLQTRILTEFENADGFSILSKFLNARKYVLAADILKIMILERFGGLYSDCGITISERFTEILEIADLCVMLGESWFFQTSFIAAPPSHPTISAFLGMISNPSTFNKTYAFQRKEPAAIDEVNMFAGPGFTAAFVLFMPKQGRIFVTACQSPDLTWRAQKSWFGENTKFGNANAAIGAPTLIGEPMPEEEFSLERAPCELANLNGIRAERFRILVKLSDYFERHPTPLCKIFHFNGSDKALGWHNYAYVYNYILEEFRYTVDNLIEIGIGTNHLDVPSSMGVTGVPGASLKAWQEWRPYGRIIGGDVDRRILFETDRIWTHFIDQTLPNTIDDFRLALGGSPASIAIDDGLHEFEANQNLFSGLYSAVSPGGVYVIEDVFFRFSAAWLRQLKANGLSGVVLRIPHWKNKSDNCLVFIFKAREETQA